MTTHVLTPRERVRQLADLDAASFASFSANGATRPPGASGNGGSGGGGGGSSTGVEEPSGLLIASFFEHIPPSTDAGTLREVVSQLRGALRRATLAEKLLRSRTAALELQGTAVSKSLVDAQNTVMDLEDALQLRLPEVLVAGAACLFVWVFGVWIRFVEDSIYLAGQQVCSLGGGRSRLNASSEADDEHDDSLLREFATQASALCCGARSIAAPELVDDCGYYY